MAITVYGSIEEYNEANKEEIAAGRLRPMTTVIHARAIDTDNPEDVAAARKEHQALSDQWRTAHGLFVHGAKYWEEYWEDDD